MDSPPHLPTQNEVDQLIALFSAGRYPELESQAQLLVERYPESGRAWKILGTALGVQGKNALSAMQRAAQLSPEDAAIHNNLGNALKDSGEYEAAAASYRKALELEPAFADAHNNLGNALKNLGQINEAVACYRRALELEPNYPDAHFNLANVLSNMGDVEGAIENYRQGLALDPNDAEMHYNLGGVLLGLGRLEAAVDAYRHALALNPDFAEAHCNLGNAYQELRQYDLAVDANRRAIAINENFAEAHNNLGNALLELKQADAAMVSFQQALALKPDFAGAHGNLGNALHDLGKIEAAMNSYRRALELDPKNAETHNNLGAVLLEIGQFDEAQLSFRRALQEKSDYVKASSNLLFALNYTASHANESCLEEARSYGRMVAKQVAQRFSAWHCAAEPKRLRVGLISGDLRNHPVGYALESLLAQIDPSSVELLAYPTSPKVDELSTRLQTHFAAWNPIYGKSDAEAAQLIHADGVHILLDLSGHTAHNRLPVFAWKPAPVQASWLGYFATTGVAEMDYLLTSEVAVPQAHRAHFTENVWYLPDTWLCFTPPQLELPVNALPALTNGRPTFGSFQRLDKISDAVLSAWGEILKAAPQARLFVANKQLGNETVAEQFRQRLQQHQIDLARVELQGAAPSRADYLARYHSVDIMLDTFPYPGVTTTCEALWMGVPTITQVGDTLLSRQGAGMLVPAGLSDWVVNSEDEYIAKAIRLSSDLPKLAALRAGLREQVLASPVYDAPRFARNFEAALWGMWREFQRTGNLEK